MNKTLVLAALALLGVSACSRSERSRAVRPGATNEAAVSASRDYRAMIERARSRQTMADVLAALGDGLDRFRNDRGRLPTNLAELVVHGYVEGIPEPPKGTAYAYDPRSGNLRLLPIDERGRLAVPEDNLQTPSLMRPTKRAPQPEGPTP